MILSIDAYLCGSDSCWADAHMVMGACMQAKVLLRIVPFRWLLEHLGGGKDSPIRTAGLAEPDTQSFQPGDIKPPIFVVRRQHMRMEMLVGFSTQTLSADCWPELEKELGEQGKDGGQ